MTSAQFAIASQALEPISIRVATFDDRPAILELHRLSLRKLGRKFYSDVEIESYLRHAPTLEDYLLADGTYFVAHVGGQLAGCGGWSLKTPDYCMIAGDAILPAIPLPRVRAMFVHPEFARRGIGRYLLADIERAILKLDYPGIRIDSTLGGVPLYERCGYKRIGRTLAVLPDGCRMRFVCLQKSFRTVFIPDEVWSG
jgi:GNAT superfamily N-acetyltransferase